MKKIVWILAMGASLSFAQGQKMRTTCNNCDSFAMSQAAMGLGEGEHLIIDVVQRTFGKYTVVCTGGGGGTEPHVRSLGRWGCSSQQFNVLEQAPTPLDFEAFAQISEMLTPTGAVQKNAVVHMPSPNSVYDLAHAAPNGQPHSGSQAQMASVRDSLWSSLVSSLGWVQPLGLRWLGEYWRPVVPINDSNKFYVQIVFPDGSTMPAEVNVEPIMTPFNPMPPIVTLFPAEARDAEGQKVPGLDPLTQFPNAPGHELVRNPSNGPGFESLARSYGYGFRSYGSGPSSNAVSCSMRMIDETNPAAGSETVCIRY